MINRHPWANVGTLIVGIILVALLSVLSICIPKGEEPEDGWRHEPDLPLGEPGG